MKILTKVYSNCLMSELSTNVLDFADGDKTEKLVIKNKVFELIDFITDNFYNTEIRYNLLVYACKVYRFMNSIIENDF